MRHETTTAVSYFQIFSKTRVFHLVTLKKNMYSIVIRKLRLFGTDNMINLRRARTFNWNGTKGYTLIGPFGNPGHNIDLERVG